MNREGVAEILRGFGVFFWVSKVEDENLDPGTEFVFKVLNQPNWLTVNQSEAILDGLGVQVVWDDSNKGIPCIVKNIKDSSHYDDKLKGEPIYWFGDWTAGKDRELANAAAVAWFCIHEPERLTFLKK